MRGPSHRHSWMPIYQLGQNDPVMIVCNECGAAKTIRPEPTEQEMLEALEGLQRIEAELSG